MIAELSILERRLKHEVPEEYHEYIEREFAKFECEVERMSPDEENIGQATLTDREIRQLPIGNQNTDDRLTLIEYQNIKARAIHEGVNRWIERVDPSLSMEENIDRIERSKSNDMVREQERMRVR